jgi:hypothetical protein
VRQDEFFLESGADWLGLTTRALNDSLIADITSGIGGRADLEVAVPLAHLVHEEFERFGTDGKTSIDGDQSRRVLLALRAVLQRLGIDFAPPFADFDRFRAYWKRNGAIGSWQARRDIVESILDPIHDQLADLESVAFKVHLVSPVACATRGGWVRVDEEIAELRRHFQIARTEQDYRNVGNDCVAILERLSGVAYVAERHLRAGEAEPPAEHTKARLERVVEAELTGRPNAELRKLVRAAIEQAQAAKHGTPNRQQAAIAANSVILIVSMFRHLVDPEY